MNVALWILQIGLGLAFAVLGYTHAFRFEPFAANPRTRWARNVGASNLRIIGILEILGGVGLILPAATGILPWLTPLAAAMLALVMVLAILFHARRPGEAPNIVVNAVLGILALAVAYGRFVIEPLQRTGALNGTTEPATVRPYRYQTSPGRQSQLIGTVGSSGGEEGVGRTIT